MNGEGKVVCATRASGYIASWIVKLLLLRVYTVRDPNLDVRDVALAHVKASETPSANGRYLICGPSVTVSDVRELLRELFPDLYLADMNGESEMNLATYKVCVEKVKSLGVEFTPIKSSLKGTLLSVSRKNVFYDKKKGK